MNDLEKLLANGFVRPYGVCSLGRSKNSLACGIDGTVEFAGKMDGGWEIEDNCPECGTELEIRHRLVIEKDVEDLPETIKEKIDFAEKEDE